MDTFIISDLSNLNSAAVALKKGGLVAVPTETVYGLAANALDPVAVQNIFKAKGRPSDNPLIIHINNLAMLDELVINMPPCAKPLIENFWPGPLTIIFEASKIIPKEVTAGLSTVAIRFPSHPVMQELIGLSGLPLAAPSANSSGKPSPTNVQRVIDDLFGKIDVIIDGGECSVGLESTILDITTTPPTLLRPGKFSKADLEAVIGSVQGSTSAFSDLQVPKAPGMKYTHYSPNADVIIVEGPINSVVNRINALVEEDLEKGLTVGVLATDELQSLFECNCILSVGELADLDTIATNLFETLRQFDDQHIDRVYSIAFPTTGVGAAIMNRLEKAAGHHIIEA